MHTVSAGKHHERLWYIIPRVAIPVAISYGVWYGLTTKVRYKRVHWHSRLVAARYQSRSYLQPQGPEPAKVAAKAFGKTGKL